jgi:alpha,alpha-trehalase
MRDRDSRHALAALFVVLLLLPSLGAFSADAPAPPSVEFGELYPAVEMAELFPDQKTFADAIPNEPPAKVVDDYERQKDLPGFDLKTFVDRHFALPKHHFVAHKPRPNRVVGDYITDMWQVLQRQPDEIEPYSSLLPLSRPYIVPGGRFREIYY